jgi:DNA invertase Pin-like site-specific DNA recombinase
MLEETETAVPIISSADNRQHVVRVLDRHSRVLDALKKEGVSDSHIFTEKVTGTKADRPGLTEALSHLRGTLVVWRLV